MRTSSCIGARLRRITSKSGRWMVPSELYPNDNNEPLSITDNMNILLPQEESMRDAYSQILSEVLGEYEQQGRDPLVELRLMEYHHNEIIDVRVVFSTEDIARIADAFDALRAVRIVYIDEQTGDALMTSLEDPTDWQVHITEGVTSPPGKRGPSGAFERPIWHVDAEMDFVPLEVQGPLDETLEDVGQSSNWFDGPFSNWDFKDDE